MLESAKFDKSLTTALILNNNTKMLLSVVLKTALCAFINSDVKNLNSLLKLPLSYLIQPRNLTKSQLPKC